MIRIEKILVPAAIAIIILGVTYTYKDELAQIFLNLINKNREIVTLEYRNKYTRDYKYNYVKYITEFDIKEKQDILNAYYSVINSGIKEFTFYCSDEYEKCKDDSKKIAEDQSLLSNINSYVNPYNSFSDIKTIISEQGEITLKITKSYTKDDIKTLNQKIDTIINEKINKTKNEKQIIKIIHDYIINNSKYDSNRSDRNIIKYKSHIAYGPLIEKYGICGGYTDSMALFLDRYNIPNFKVISENHIWNAVYLDDNWYHLDLTWDDPVLSDGSDTIEYNIFLISTKELEELKTTQHNFNKEVFSEVK